MPITWMFGRQLCRGRRGSFARWPKHAEQQAVWVKAQLDAGRSFDEIRHALTRGEFIPG